MADQVISTSISVMGRTAYTLAGNDSLVVEQGVSVEEIGGGSYGINTTGGGPTSITIKGTVSGDHGIYLANAGSNTIIAEGGRVSGLVSSFVLSFDQRI